MYALCVVRLRKQTVSVTQKRIYVYSTAVKQGAKVHMIIVRIRDSKGRRLLIYVLRFKIIADNFDTVLNALTIL